MRRDGQAPLGRHLIHEVHDELDWTEQEIQRVQEELAETDRHLARRLAGLSTRDAKGREALLAEVSAERRAKAEALGLPQLYSLQNGAAQRFARLARVYDIGCANADAATISQELARFLFRTGDEPETLPGAIQALDRLGAALSRYFNGGLNDETDQSIRDAWMELEGVFVALGRKS